MSCNVSSGTLNSTIPYHTMLSDVCLSVAYIRPRSRTERTRKTKIGTEVAHVTCDSHTTFKVKVTAVLARQAAAALGVGTCWPWETAATLPSAQRSKALRRPRGRRGAGSYRGSRPPTACFSQIALNATTVFAHTYWKKAALF